MVIALWRAVRRDWLEEQERERALRKRLRELAEKPDSANERSALP